MGNSDYFKCCTDCLEGAKSPRRPTITTKEDWSKELERLTIELLNLLKHPLAKFNKLEGRDATT